MRDLSFWLEKYKSANQKFIEAHSKIISLQSTYKYMIFPYKLKSQYGHALNRDYTGYKVQARRKKWLKKRLINLTQTAALTQQCRQLVQTKLSFYEKKIIELGGTIPDDKFYSHWKNKYKR